MKKLIIGAVALAVAAIGIGSLATPSAFANPSAVTVFNINVATALKGSAVTCDNVATTGLNDNAANLAAWQTASAGQVTNDTANAGNTCIAVQTDGSVSPVSLNGRGLTCAPLCDGVVTTVPVTLSGNTFAAFVVSAAGTFTTGGVATAVQNSVSVDSIAMTKVAQPNNFALTVAKATIQEGATTCGITDSTTGPTKSPAVATFTDLNSNNLVGYSASWSPSFTAGSKGGFAIGGTAFAAGTSTVSMLLTDGTTIAAYNVLCGKAAGTVSAAASSGPAACTTTCQIAGTTGPLTRTQSVTVTGVPASIALTASPAAIPCDGTSTSTVTAKVTDSAGNNVVDGTTVTFNVVALGTANPINATTTGGSATSVITPLSGGTAGTIVNVVSGSAAASIRIDCLPSLATATAGAAGATPTPRGGVVGPNTGTGGYLGQDSSSSFSMWTLVALALGSVVLVAGGLVTRRAGK